MSMIKATKVEFLIPNETDAKHFVTEILPILREEHKLKHVFFHQIEYYTI